MSTPIGGATRGFWIEPNEVHKAAEAARKVAQDLPQDIKALFTPTDAAVVGLAGFHVAQAIDDCLEAWTKALRSLAGLVDSAADAVGSSNKSFTHEEQERRKTFLGPYAPGVSPPGLSHPYTSAPPSANGGY
ncbi:hypothetical protein [Streptomyces sp. NBC_01022]|uniref:hypothetical protein n=1 Tax=Streptomyces sp. NBC_01022 TaxID=2903723 RepID=UPI002DDA735D|nr:hypothetical protein [Streptomyces sp. NBC_01022]WRZ82043.1 hypothetical protein OG316_18130 [Streptomyces sp. NBC_01022]